MIRCQEMKGTLCNPTSHVVGLTPEGLRTYFNIMSNKHRHKLETRARCSFNLYLGVEQRTEVVSLGCAVVIRKPQLCASNIVQKEHLTYLYLHSDMCIK
jgi:hypothetical protein